MKRRRDRGGIHERDRESRLVLEHRRIEGDVRSTGRAAVKLLRCEVSGRIEKDPSATLPRE